MLIMIPINKRKVGVCILLYLITFGIYGIYWKYLLVKNIRAIKGDNSSCVGEMLLMGNRVQLDGLGTIFVTLSSDGMDDAEEFSAAQITGVKPHMSFEEDFCLELQKAEFENVASREAQAAAKKAEKQAKNEAMGVSTSTDEGGTSGGDDGDGVTE